MKRIGIDINGVLRDTIGKFTTIYEKHLIENGNDEDQNNFELTFSGDDVVQEVVINDDNFVYEQLSDVTSLNLMEHFKFKSVDELYDFMYEEFAMEIFGHAPSTELMTFNYLNEFYFNQRDEYDITLLSNEISKSKPATLFFLSKFGCMTERLIFYNEITKNSIWENSDILLTANPDLLLEYPSEKILVKYLTNYNKHIPSDYEITSLNQFEGILKKIESYV